MPKTIKATDAVRAFSEILNSVKYQHESYTITRGGKPAAALVPVDALPAKKTIDDLLDFISGLPRLGDDIEHFMSDIEDSVSRQPTLPEKSVWE